MSATTPMCQFKHRHCERLPLVPRPFIVKVKVSQSKSTKVQIRQYNENFSAIAFWIKWNRKSYNLIQYHILTFSFSNFVPIVWTRTGIAKNLVGNPSWPGFLSSLILAPITYLIMGGKYHNIAMIMTMLVLCNRKWVILWPAPFMGCRALEGRPRP